MVTVSYIIERKEGCGRGVLIPFCVSVPQNGYFPISAVDAALLAVAVAPEVRKKSDAATEKIYN